MDQHAPKKHRPAPVQRAFSKAAARYDEHAEIQEHLGLQLLARLPKKKHFIHVLDVGMGTGRMTRVLTKMYPSAQVVGIDFAHGMLLKARHNAPGIRVVQANAEHLPFSPAKFDLVVSNLVYQWIENLPRAFMDVQRVTTGGGFFWGTLFGGYSLHEMFDAFAAGGAKDLFVRRLPTLAEVEQALKMSRFKIRQLHTEILTFEFHGMWDLLLWLKKIGANAVAGRVFIGKKIFTKANQYYYEHFKTPGGVAVTFELIWFEAER